MAHSPCSWCLEVSLLRFALLTPGNYYSILNKFKHPATLVFSQGRKVTQNAQEREQAQLKEAQERRAIREERERDRVELDPEDFEAKWDGWVDGLKVIDDLTSEQDGLSDESPGRFSYNEEPSYGQDGSESDRTVTNTPDPEPVPEVPVKRGPGRPRKNPDEPKRQTAKRGRPSKRGRGKA